MKNSGVTGLVAALLLSTPVMAQQPQNCGQLSGSVTETDSNSQVERIITRFQTVNGPVYTYELFFQPNVFPAGAKGGTYPVNAILNGQKAQVTGMLANTNEGDNLPPALGGGGSVTSGSCGNEGLDTNTIDGPLFTHARDGGHLNAWQGSFQANGAAPVNFSFPQETLSTLPWPASAAAVAGGLVGTQADTMLAIFAASAAGSGGTDSSFSWAWVNSASCTGKNFQDQCTTSTQIEQGAPTVVALHTEDAGAFWSLLKDAQIPNQPVAADGTASIKVNTIYCCWGSDCGVDQGRPAPLPSDRNPDYCTLNN